MHYDIVLPHACTQDVWHGVQKLAAIAEAEMWKNEYRPQHPSLYAAEFEPERRPVYVQPAARRLIAIFNRLPAPGVPCGDRLFIVGIPHKPGCVDSCIGKCREPLTVEVRWDPRFPLDFIESRYLFGRMFGLNEVWLLNTHPSWLATTLMEEEIAQSEIPPGRKSGAPLCQSTQQLEVAIEQLKNMHENRHLMPDWLGWYEQAHGYLPRDPEGSFRHAVATCLRRIERRRKESSAHNHRTPSE